MTTPHSQPDSDEVWEIVANAIREYCRSKSPAAVQISSDDIERIYYAGLSVFELADAITLALSRPQGNTP